MPKKYYTNNRNRCSPERQKGNNGSCFRGEEIDKIHKTLLEYTPDISTKVKYNELREEYGDEKLWLDRFSSDELEDLGLDPNTIFLPKKPLEWSDNPNTWLSNSEIDRVMFQLQRVYPFFLYISATPVDYDTIDENGDYVSEMLAKINLNKILKNGKTSIGIIFNLDKHTMNGSHWVAAYVNLKKASIYYSDSVGNEPTEDMNRLFEKIKKQGDALIKKNKITNICNVHSVTLKCERDKDKTVRLHSNDVYTLEEGDVVFFLKDTPKNRSLSKTARIDNYIPTRYYTIKNVEGNRITVDKSIKDFDDNGILISRTFKLFYNDIQQQSKDTECGVYAMHFIYHLLQENNYCHNSFYDYGKVRKKDEDIEKWRDIFFREANGELNEDRQDMIIEDSTKDESKYI